METESKIPAIITDNRTKIVNGLLVVGGAYVVYRIGKKIIAEAKKGSTQKKADDSPSVRQAMALRNGINPSGMKWLMSSDGTNESLILDTAQGITNLDEVQVAYKNLYQSNLLDDLQKELSGEDYSKFMTLVTVNPSKKKTKGGSGPVKFAEKQSPVVAKKEVTLRTSADASNHGAFYEVFSKNNIIRTATAGEFLGYATGNQHFDEVNNVKFIEAAYVVVGSEAPEKFKSLDGQRVSFWVSSSSKYVEVLASVKELQQRYPSGYNQTKWMKAPGVNSGSKDEPLKGFLGQALITLKSSNVLDDKFQVIAKVSANTLLGELVMTLNTGKGQFYKFKTVDNTNRWVHASGIKIQNR